MEAFIGTILPWAGTYAPQGWLFCQGQTLQVNQYAAVFAVLGTTYGGNGTTNFMLPNLQGRIPVGAGVLPGTTTTFRQGAVGGAIDVANNLPAHTHGATLDGSKLGVSFGLQVSTNTGAKTAPPADAPTAAKYGLAKVDGSALGGDVNLYRDISNDGTAVVKLKSFPCDVTPIAGTVAVGSTGSTTATTVPVMQPYQVINYIICINGIFPQRD